MKLSDSREGARRQHRALGLYAALFCWIRGADGVAIPREALERLLGLERIRSERVGWLRKDLRALFPECAAEWTIKPSSLTWMAFSRSPFGDLMFPHGRSKASGEIRSYAPKGPECVVLKIWPKLDEDIGAEQELSALAPFLGSSKSNQDERLLTAYLALLSSGQINVEQVPTLAVKKRARG